MKPDQMIATNQRVRFRLRDSYLPPPDELLSLLHADEILEGVVVDVSRAARGVAVVIRLTGTDRLVVLSDQDLL
jgi:hypothetical protein